MIDVQPTVQETPKPSDPALDAILQERLLQDAKWGEQNHDGEKWVLIATEELGEVCQALLKGDKANYRQELTQLAAVTLAWLQCEHRRGSPVVTTTELAPVSPSKIVHMERSETSNSKSPMWRCIDEDGDRVNVFKHSDPKKDTFKLFSNAGYGPIMELMTVGDVLTWKDHPISVHMQKKGNWWEITRVEQIPEGGIPDRAYEFAASKDKEISASWARLLVEAGNFVVLDTETTGLNRGGKKDEPVQIAVVASDGTVLLDTLVKPTVSVDDEAAATHHITAEMLAGAPVFNDIRGKLVDALKGKTVVIYNADYDTAIIDNVNGIHFDLASDWQCAMNNYAQFYGEYNMRAGSYKWHSLTKACEQQGITDIEAPLHSALGDCQATLALIKVMAAYEPAKTDEHPF